MNRFVFSWFFFTLAALPVFSQDSDNGGNQDEGTFVNACAENITLKIYSPSKAAECLERLDKDEYFIDRLKERDDITASRLLAYLNSLKDLGEFFLNTQDEHLKTGLRLRLESYPCVLCDLALGPQPEKLYPWVSKYAPRRLVAVQKAAYDWSTLPETDREYLIWVKKKSPEAWPH